MIVYEERDADLHVCVLYQNERFTRQMVKAPCRLERVQRRWSTN